MSTTIARHPDRLTDRTVLLIAGTGGIGRAIASALLSRGARVILTSTRREKLDDTITQLHTLYPHLPSTSISGYTLDLGSPTVEENIIAFVAALRAAETTHIHHLIYLAGDALSLTPLATLTLASWLAASQVRTISALLVLKHLLPFLTAAGAPSVSCSPSITLTGGSVGDKPIPGGWTLTAMIAGGLQAAARQLALDLAPVRVNTVAPGVVATDLWSGMDEGAKQAFFTEHAGKMPTGRVGAAQDVAEAYLWCLLDGNVTGEVVRTNSGVLLV